MQNNFRQNYLPKNRTERKDITMNDDLDPIDLKKTGIKNDGFFYTLGEGIFSILQFMVGICVAIIGFFVVIGTVLLAICIDLLPIILAVFLGLVLFKACGG